MRELDVVGVRLEMPSQQPIVLLRERDGERYVPIWVAAPEASAIAFAQQGLIPPRPLTHDLLKEVITALGAHVQEVHIVELRDNVFHAQLVFSDGLKVDCRSSDAIALALRTGSVIMGADEVIEAVGVMIPDDDEDEVEKFREFLDHISADDFDDTGLGPNMGDRS